MSDHPNINDLLGRLRQVTRNAAGWKACCPAHDDQHPSLSVSIGASGGIVVYCHAQQCSAESIAQAAGMELRDFAPPEMLNTATAKPTPELSLEQRIVACYDYRDERGELLYQSVRLRDPKDFRQRRVCGARLNAKDEREPIWEWKLTNTRRVLYRMPELLAADPSRWVLIVEGEKDADNLVAAGMIATTAAQGAGKWHTLDPAVLQAFRGRRVAILPDHDAPGIRHAVAVAKSLEQLAADLRVVQLPGGKLGEDASDWLAAGGTPERLMTLIQLAPVWCLEHANRLANLGDELEAEKEAQKAAKKSSKAAASEQDIRLTDVGNSLRFARQHRDTARYVGSWGTWLIWTGTHWERDETHRIDLLGKETIRTIFREAGAQSHSAGAQLETWTPGQTDGADRLSRSIDAAKALGQHAIKSESAPRIAAMIRLAQSELPIQHSQLDADPYLFNCLNGTINLRTGAFYPHRREDYLTSVAPVEYDPKATCPQWEASLRSIFPETPLADAAPGDQEMIAFVRRLFGYCLSGDVSEQSLAICHGEGSNGKTLMLETICDILGPYATPSPEGLLLTRRSEQHPTELADLLGRRLVHAAETADGAKLDEARVKRLTGSETIKARFMNQDFFHFKPTHKLVVCTNHRPRVKGADHAIWRRVVMIPFEATFWDEDSQIRGERLERFRKNKSLTRTKFGHERSGILNWLLAGFRDWQAIGLSPPERVKAATREYREAEDVIGQFVAERCQIVPDRAAKIKSGELYWAFLQWCDENGEMNRTSQRAFSQRIIKETGFELYLSRGRWFQGVSLVDSKNDDGDDEKLENRSSHRQNGSQEYDDNPELDIPD